MADKNGTTAKSYVDPSPEVTKFCRYARGRSNLLALRLLVGTFGVLLLYSGTNLMIAVIAALTFFVGEALDTISLNQSIRRLKRGAPLAPEIRFSVFTGIVQAVLFSLVVLGAAILMPDFHVDMFLIPYLFAGVMTAGIVYFYNPPATLCRMTIFAITAFGLLTFRWMSVGPQSSVIYETLGVLLLAYVAYRVIQFASDSFFVQEQEQQRASDSQLSLQTANRQLMQNEMHLRQLAAVAENANDSIILFDITGRITWVNDTFTQLTGYSLEEAVGRRAGTLLNGPMTSVDTVLEIDSAVKNMTPLRTEIQNYTKAGDAIWVETNIVPVPPSRDHPGGIVAIERNITNAKIRETELAQAKAKAEYSEQAKMQFLATTSHEIRTPMNSIIGLADLLAEQHLNEEAQSYVTTMQDSAAQLLRIVDDILDLSKLEAGKLRITPSVFSTREMFDKIEALVRPRAEAKGLTLTLELPANMPNILADEGRIRQILMNLIDNAIKFTASGGVTVTVTAGMMAQTCRFSVEVSDSGIGMSDAALQKLFGLYTQAEDTTASRFGGTGLGLAISRHLAREMGGDLTAVSQQGQGSSFSLFLPVPCATATGIDLPKPAAVTNPNSLTWSEGRHILVAEDNPTNRLLMSKFLADIGAQVSFVEDGQQAVAACTAQPIDLILMDMQMPEVDGLEATRQIRKLDIPQPYIIALTANAHKEDRDRCIEAGMDDFLSKPLRKTELLERLAQALATPDPAPRALDPQPQPVTEPAEKPLS